MNSNPLPHSQLLDALRWRYATKVFDPNRTIAPDSWAALEDSLVLSASSFGLQPYRFFVVKDRAVREQLLPHSWGQRQVVDASHYLVFAARTGITQAEIDGFIQRVTAARGVPADSLNGYRELMKGFLLNEGNKSAVPQWTARQVYIALGNLLTSAAMLGIDTCPIEGFVPAEYDRILNLTGLGLTSVVCCALGFRNASDKYAHTPKFRFPKSDLVKTV
jgi:nitroreductase